jgi:hypothetical protein
MDDDLIQTVRAQVAASNRSVGLSFDEARLTTVYSQELVDQYRSAESAASGVAAFRLEAFLSEPTNHPVGEHATRAIADALRARSVQRTLSLGMSDLRIGLALHAYGSFDQKDVESLVTSMQGVDDFSVATEAPRLLPIIGPDFIQDYLRSTELFETRGMGGPQRPLIREMAEAALSNFNAAR